MLIKYCSFQMDKYLSTIKCYVGSRSNIFTYKNLLFLFDNALISFKMWPLEKWKYPLDCKHTDLMCYSVQYLIYIPFLTEGYFRRRKGRLVMLRTKVRKKLTTLQGENGGSKRRLSVIKINFIRDRKTRMENGLMRRIRYMNYKYYNIDFERSIQIIY